MNAKNGVGGGGGGELQVTHFCMFAVSPVRCLGFYCAINNPECVVCLITDNISIFCLSLCCTIKVHQQTGAWRMLRSCLSFAGKQFALKYLEIKL